jgi:hypothetical protein
MNKTGEKLMKMLQKWVFILGAVLAFSPACNKQTARTEQPPPTNSGAAHEIIGPTNLQVAGVVFYGDSQPASYVKVTIVGTNLQTIQESVADSNGHFVFKDLGAGPLEVWAGFVPFKVVGVKRVEIITAVPNRTGFANVSAGDTNVVIHIIGGLP